MYGRGHGSIFLLDMASNHLLKAHINTKPDHVRAWRMIFFPLLVRQMATRQRERAASRRRGIIVPPVLWLAALAV